MESEKKLIVFKLDEQKYALDLAGVERGLRMIEITPVPKAPASVMGIINIGGRIIPVLNTRTLLGLPVREISLDDHLLITGTEKVKVALLIDEIVDILDFASRDFIAGKDIFPGLECRGAVRLEDDIIFIYDLDRFLFNEDLSSITEEPHGSGVIGGDHKNENL